MRRRPSSGDHHDGRQDTKGLLPGRPDRLSACPKHVDPIDGYRRAASCAEDLDPQRVLAILEGGRPDDIAGLECRAVRVDGGDEPPVHDDARLATRRADGAGPRDRGAIERVRRRSAASLRPMRSAVEITRIVHERPRPAVADRGRGVRQRRRDGPVRRAPVAGLAVAIDRPDPVAHLMRRREDVTGDARCRGDQRQAHPVSGADAVLELIAVEARVG